MCMRRGMLGMGRAHRACPSPILPPGGWVPLLQREEGKAYMWVGEGRIAMAPR